MEAWGRGFVSGDMATRGVGANRHYAFSGKLPEFVMLLPEECGGRGQPVGAMQAMILMYLQGCQSVAVTFCGAGPAFTSTFR